MIADIEFHASAWLTNYYHLMGTVSLILNSYTLFLILFKTDKLDSFKYYLLGFQIMCFIVDFHLTLLLQPQPFHPIPAGFCSGFLTYKNFVSSHILMTSVIGLMGSQFGGLVLCFLRKYLVFRKLTRSQYSHKYLVTAVFVVYCIFVVFLVIIIYHCGLSREEEFRIIREKYPTYEAGFQSVPNFTLYDFNTYWVALLVGCTIATFYAGSIFAYTTFSMLHILMDLQKMSSASNYRKQKRALISLIAQLSTTLIAIIPITILTVSLLIEFEYAQVSTRFMLAIFCSHSSINAIVLILTTPPFRRFTFFWFIEKRSSILVSLVIHA